MTVVQPSSSKTILFIDPHKEDREYWAQRLSMSSSDYVVLEAQTGIEGLVMCQSQRVDCVITELTLPDMSGLEVLVKLLRRAYRPEIAVVILSRTWLPSMAQLARTNGAQAYLMKSQTSGDELVQVIRTALATFADA